MKYNKKIKPSVFLRFSLWIPVLLSSLSSAQILPTSPCPEIFSYEQASDNSIIGRVTLPNPSYGSHKLEINLSLKAQLKTSYVGKIELYNTEDLHNVIASGSNVNYKVLFPLPAPLPSVTSIKFNGNVLCNGPPQRFTGPGQYLTAIDLQHTLRVALSNVPQYAVPGTANGPPPITQNYDPNPPAVQNQNIYDGVFGNNNRPSTSQNTFQNANQNNYYDNNNNNNKYPMFARPTAPRRTTTTTTTTTTTSTPRTTTETYYEPPRIQPQKDPELNEDEICGKPAFLSVGLIYHGDTTAPGDWPWIVAIFHKKPGGISYACTGTLMSPTIAVTAGHCTFDRPRAGKKIEVDKYVLRVGAYNIQEWEEENGVVRGVKNVVYPPSFNETDPTYIDLALLVFSKSVRYDDYIRPICIWNGPNILNGISGSVVGWGRDEKQNVAVPDPRRTVVPIINSEECKKSQPAFTFILTEHGFCAGKRDGTGPCNGDSGAGLYVWRNNHYEFKGVVSVSLPSHGTGTCDLDQYIIYNDAAKFASWLRRMKRMY